MKSVVNILKKLMMKKHFRLAACAAISILTIGLITSCESSKDDNTPPPQTLDLGDGSTAYEIKTDITLEYPNTYNLKGFVYVTSGATLTIQPGVIIKGEKSSKGTLIVERGGKIVAQGTKDRPIVFTSAQAPGNRKPGDWGGIIILGNAPNNQGEMAIEGGVRSKHGGTEAADNSGILSYVRCEFAGIEYSVDNEINGITFGSVGTGTKVDHVQVSYSGDDSFEWFGGTVNATHLVALATWDDDFDTDNGFNGKIQFAVALRNPKIADKSSSNGFESDNHSAGTPAEPTTKPIFANISLFGPVSDPTSYNDQGNEEGSTVGIFQAGVQIRRSSQCNLFNSVIAGFPVGLIIENDKTGANTQESATAGNLNVSGCVIAGSRRAFQDKAKNPKNREDVVDMTVPDTFVKNYWETEALSNLTPLTTIAELQLVGNPQNLTSPNMIPQLTSPLATGAVWTHANVSDAFFTKTTYRGAFSPTETVDNNWMSGWTNFDPQNTAY